MGQVVKYTNGERAIMVNPLDEDKIARLEEAGYERADSEEQPSQAEPNPFEIERYRYHTYQHADRHGYSGWYEDTFDGQTAGFALTDGGWISVDDIDGEIPEAHTQWESFEE